MKFTEVIKNRQSIRGYSAKPVEQEKLARVLEAARLAPTAKNLQPFKLYIIDTKKNKEKLLKIYAREWFLQAPYTILICRTPEDSFTRSDGKNYQDIDIAIAMDHLILAATDQGLGTCWVGAFDAEITKQELKLPAGYEPIAFTPLGYPNDPGHEKKRKNIEELAEYI